MLITLLLNLVKLLEFKKVFEGRKILHERPHEIIDYKEIDLYTI